MVQRLRVYLPMQGTKIPQLEKSALQQWRSSARKKKKNVGIKKISEAHFFFLNYFYEELTVSDVGTNQRQKSELKTTRRLSPCISTYLLMWERPSFFPSGTMLSHSSLYMSAEWGDGQMSNTSFMNGSKWTFSPAFCSGLPGKWEVNRKDKNWGPKEF